MKSHTSDNKAQTMVVACVNAIGQAIPPYVIYNAKTLNPEWMKDDLRWAQDTLSASHLPGS